LLSLRSRALTFSPLLLTAPSSVTTASLASPPTIPDSASMLAPTPSTPLTTACACCSNSSMALPFLTTFSEKLSWYACWRSDSSFICPIVAL
jgi:hypothetical protein